MGMTGGRYEARSDDRREAGIDVGFTSLSGSVTTSRRHRRIPRKGWIERPIVDDDWELRQRLCAGARKKWVAIEMRNESEEDRAIKERQDKPERAWRTIGDVASGTATHSMAGGGRLPGGSSRQKKKGEVDGERAWERREQRRGGEEKSGGV